MQPVLRGSTERNWLWKLKISTRITKIAWKPQNFWIPNLDDTSFNSQNWSSALHESVQSQNFLLTNLAALSQARHIRRVVAVIFKIRKVPEDNFLHKFLINTDGFVDWFCLKTSCKKRGNVKTNELGCSRFKITFEIFQSESLRFSLPSIITF